MSADLDLVREYKDYLERFTIAVGDSDFGKFVKHQGRLVKKMRYDEFEPIYTEYYGVASTYFDSIDRGDTINDVVVKVLRERAIELFLQPPV
jgi:hypothetical protein